MKAVVLLSAGLHPVSGRPAPVGVEAQAIQLALSLGAEPVGLHAGANEAAVADYLGYGVSQIVLAAIAEDDDPVPSLIEALRAASADVVLAGRRGSGGTDSGLLPYRIACALSWPIVADAVKLVQEGNLFAIEQALPHGARRRVRVRLPCLVTVHPAAPASLPFTFGAARRGQIIRRQGMAAPLSAPALEERPYRRRPRLIGAVRGGSAAERLKAATEATGAAGRVLIDPPPEVAATEILAFMRSIGLLKQSSD